MKARERIRFTPVQLKTRHDGWTPARQVRFIETLTRTRSITSACTAVGMSRESAYKLRERPDARSFRLAWDDALRPDFERSERSSRIRRRLRRFASPKVDEMEEVEGPPISAGRGQPTSSPLPTLETLLEQLRAGMFDAPTAEPLSTGSR
jgi:hypothetical protein